MFSSLSSMFSPAPNAPTAPNTPSTPAVRQLSSDGQVFGRQLAQAPPVSGDSTGEDTSPNNSIALDCSNAFICLTHLSASTAALGAKKAREIAPDSVACKVSVGETSVIYDLTVAFTNPFSETAAVLLEIPRLPNVVLLSEEHRAGDIEFAPTVKEKETAEREFAQAAASDTHTATLSGTTDEIHEIRLDKVAQGASGQFRVRFIQQGVREQPRVMESSADNAEMMGDIVILPGFTPLDTPGVPFSLSVELASAFSARPVPDAVMLHDCERLRPDILSYLVFEPTAPNERTLSFTSPTGFATGTLIKARFARPLPDSLSTAFGALSLGSQAVGTLQEGVQGVSTFPSVCFDPLTGEARDVSLVEYTVPIVANGLQPSQNSHNIYVVLDTSGSTGMPCEDATFLPKCKAMLKAILEALPAQIHLIRSSGLINQKPIQLHLWVFNCGVTKCVTVSLKGNQEEMQALVSHSVLPCLSGFRSGGGTSYESWSSALAADVKQHLQDPTHVLLLTDGGANMHFSGSGGGGFKDTIQSLIAETSSRGGFLQCDALGYGPWLNPATVHFLSSKTNGEAVMGDSPSGESMRSRAMGLLGRSLVRGANRREVVVRNATVLAVKSDATVGFREDSLDTSGVISTTPGAKLTLSLVHRHAQAPTLSHGTDTVAVTPAATDADDVSLPPCMLGTAKETQMALAHLLVLEPVYAEGVHYPDASAALRRAATLAVSLRGQIAAPSVTRASAVAQLQSALSAVPVSAQPEVVGFKPIKILFQDEPDAPLHAPSSFSFGSAARSRGARGPVRNSMPVKSRSRCVPEQAVAQSSFTFGCAAGAPPSPPGAAPFAAAQPLPMACPAPAPAGMSLPGIIGAFNVNSVHSKPAGAGIEGVISATRGGLYSACIETSAPVPHDPFTPNAGNSSRKKVLRATLDPAVLSSIAKRAAEDLSRFQPTASTTTTTATTAQPPASSALEANHCAFIPVRGVCDVTRISLDAVSGNWYHKAGTTSDVCRTQYERLPPAERALYIPVTQARDLGRDWFRYSMFSHIGWCDKTDQLLIPGGNWFHKPGCTYDLCAAAYWMLPDSERALYVCIDNAANLRGDEGPYNVQRLANLFGSAAPTPTPTPPSADPMHGLGALLADSAAHRLSPDKRLSRVCSVCVLLLRVPGRVGLTPLSALSPPDMLTFCKQAGLTGV